MGKLIRRQVTEDQICVLTFDRPGSAANLFDWETLEDLAGELDYLEKETSLRGLVFASAKPGIFMAGADLNFLGRHPARDEVYSYLEFGQRQFNRIAALSIPTVAAIHGAALGGGYEVCLACQYRIGSTDRTTQIGLPEVTLGLLPAWGGATRLQRLIGLDKSLEIILNGQKLDVQRALAAGVVDALEPAANLMHAAHRKIITEGPKLQAPRSREVPAPETLAALKDTWRRAILKKTRGHNPAAFKALEVILAGVNDSFEQSLAREREITSDLVQSEPTQNLIRFFFLQQRARKKRTEANSLRPVKHVAVIGAGTMGAGIAYWVSSRGRSVLLQDINPELVDRGMERIAQTYAGEVRRHALSAAEGKEALARISTDCNQEAMGRVDLLIEAVVEVLEAKKDVFRRMDSLLSEGALLATNTSALPIAELAAVTQRPDRVIGIHFFNPVSRMPLVEIVPARFTSMETLERARRFVQEIGKSPVVVKDSPGFVSNRVLGPYFMEAARLLDEGANRDAIDEAMLELGLAMGPLRVMDEVGIDVVLLIADFLTPHLGERVRPPDFLRRMLESGKLGRKAGAGFYFHGPPDSPPARDYQGGAPIRPSTDRAADLSRKQIQDRIILMMINECARCVEEGIAGAADVDLILILGAGYAPACGGPLGYADSVGLLRIVADMERLAKAEDERFQPCELIRSLAAQNKKFHGE